MVWIGQLSKNVHSHMELIEWTHGNTLLKDQLKNQFLWIQFILIIGVQRPKIVMSGHHHAS